MLVNPKNGEQVILRLHIKPYAYYWRDLRMQCLRAGCNEEGGAKYVAELDLATATLWEGGG